MATRRRYRRFRPWMLNGRPGNISLACKRFIVRAVNAGLHVTSTTGGRHSTGSYHYPRPFRGAKGRAVDVAGPSYRMLAFQRQEARRRPRRYRELFGPAAFYIKNGRRHDGAFPAHGDHVHGAPRW